jgi:hypothetical protein
MSASELNALPPLPLDEWKDTYATLHMWTQIVGKIRLAQGPPINHWWGTTLYVTSRGLTTSPMPYAASGAAPRTFQIDFDFIDHNLQIRTSDGEIKTVRLEPRSVADFYRATMGALASAGIDVKIHTTPSEVPDPIPFPEDTVHAAYDPQFANRFWRILVQVDRVFNEFRSRFIGKSSPVHFFWGSFDLAVTRFSGRRAPERAGADAITREAYSHEVISCGFWPGSGEIKSPAFYCYAAPEPLGFGESRVAPSAAFYSKQVSEFFLMYDDVRLSDSPDDTLLQFLQTTYEAGANLAKWDRAVLERSE